jgi:hypothetical protein
VTESPAQDDKQNGPNAVLLEYISDFTKEMEEMLVIQSELAGCIRAMEIWTESYASPREVVDDQSIIGACLFRDSIVQFVGCFSDTERYKLRRKAIYTNHAGADDFFKWLQSLRDCYAAHSFGAWRQAVVGILVDGTTSKVLGIGWAVGKFAGTEQSGGPGFVQFMSLAKKHVDAIVLKLSEKLDADRGRLSAEEIAKLKPATLRSLRPDQARLSRSQFKANSGKG